jgi:hypothetical protein
VEYDEFARGEELDQKAAALFPSATGLVVAGVRSYRVDGACPRCAHRVTKSGTLDLLVPSGHRLLQEGVTDMIVPLRCSCAFLHEGAPEAVKGCGAEFIVTVPAVQIEVMS